MQFESLPDGWYEVEYETGPKRGDGPYSQELDAVWAAADDEILLFATQSVSATGEVSYPINVEQHISKNGLSTEIQSHTQVADDVRDAEQLAFAFMEEVNAGLHKLRVMDVTVPDEMDFVQFYTISDSELPEGMTGDQIIEIVENTDGRNEISGLPDKIDEQVADEQFIQVDVFPKHYTEVDGLDNDTQ